MYYMKLLSLTVDLGYYHQEMIHVSAANYMCVIKVIADVPHTAACLLLKKPHRAPAARLRDGNEEPKT